MSHKVGEKFSSNKPKWHLLPMSTIAGLVEVLTYGDKKYPIKNNWKSVAPEEYYSAMHRHLEAIGKRKELYDAESKCHHAFHFFCNAMFICWFLIRGNTKWLDELYE